MKIYTGKIKPTATPHANIRPIAGLSQPPIGKAYPNSPFKGKGELILADGYYWMELTELNGLASVGWLATVSLEYTISEIPDVIDFPESIWVSLSENGERREYKLVT